MLKANVLKALLVALFAGCASQAGNDEPKTRPDLDVITQEQMLEHRFPTVHDAVASLRGRWLVPRGTNSLYSQSRILVYMDNNRLGGVETLRNIPVNSIVYVRWFNANEATARWGIDHTQGVIFLSTHPATDPAGKGNP